MRRQQPGVKVMYEVVAVLLLFRRDLYLDQQQVQLGSVQEATARTTA
jgi:hypothetical protein